RAASHGASALDDDGRVQRRRRIRWGRRWGRRRIQLRRHRAAVRQRRRHAEDRSEASAIAKKVDVKLAPVPAYTEYWSSPIRKDPTSVPPDEKQAFVQGVVDAVVKNRAVSSVTASVGIGNEWRYFASTEGSYIEQETFEITPAF